MTYPHAIVTSIEAPTNYDSLAVCMASAVVSLDHEIEIAISGIRVLRPDAEKRRSRVVKLPCWRESSGNWRQAIHIPRTAWDALALAVLSAAAAAYPPSTTLEPTT